MCWSYLQTGRDISSVLWCIPQFDWGVHICQCSKFGTLCSSCCWFSCSVISMHHVLSNWAGKNTHAGKSHCIIWYLANMHSTFNFFKRNFGSRGSKCLLGIPTLVCHDNIGTGLDRCDLNNSFKYGFLVCFHFLFIKVDGIGLDKWLILLPSLSFCWEFEIYLPSLYNLSSFCCPLNSYDTVKTIFWELTGYSV